jgi:hypothetical protein
MERVKGIEPSSQAWEARILPLNHTRAPGEAMSSTKPIGLQLLSLPCLCRSFLNQAQLALAGIRPQTTDEDGPVGSEAHELPCVRPRLGGKAGRQRVSHCVPEGLRRRLV